MPITPQHSAAMPSPFRSCAVGIGAAVFGGADAVITAPSLERPVPLNYTRLSLCHSRRPEWVTSGAPTRGKRGTQPNATGRSQSRNPPTEGTNDGRPRLSVPQSRRSLPGGREDISIQFDALVRGWSVEAVRTCRLVSQCVRAAKRN